MSGFFERLSPQDATFVYAESPTEPMHVGGLGILEASDVTFDELCAHVEARLDLVPRFRRKLRTVSFGRPVWVDDADFDIRYHVRHTGLPNPGGERELLALMGRLQSVPLDRSRPLWELWFVDLPEGRRALIQKTHHALIDGISGVDVATVLYDLTPDSPKIDAPKWEAQPAPSDAELLVATLRDRAQEPVAAAQGLVRRLRNPSETMGRLSGILDFGKSSLESPPPTSLNQPIGAHRRYDVVRTRLADVKSIRKAYGCTLNDVVLAVVAGGLRHILSERGDDVTGLYMKALVPVSVRATDQRMTFGNKVAGLFPALPVGEPDPRERLRYVQAQMRNLKESDEVLGAEAIMKLADFAPPTIVSLAGRLMSGANAINLTVTNVPGPQFPLYLKGAKMEEVFAYVPLVRTTDIGIALISYDGDLTFGITGDWDSVPDLHLLAEGIEKSLGEYLADVNAGGD